MKYDWKFKLDCVLKYQQGRRDFVPKGISKHSFLSRVRDWRQNYEDLGIDGLKHLGHCREWTREKRFTLVAQVMAGHSLQHIARINHINPGQLYQWLRIYREKGVDGLQCLRKGRPPKNGLSLEIMPKKITKLPPSEKEELELLRKRNEYLELENQYLKKLKALELEKTAKLAKAKKPASSKASKKKTDAA